MRYVHVSAIKERNLERVKNLEVRPRFCNKRGKGFKGDYKTLRYIHVSVIKRGFKEGYKTLKYVQVSAIKGARRGLQTMRYFQVSAKRGWYIYRTHEERAVILVRCPIQRVLSKMLPRNYLRLHMSFRFTIYMYLHVHGH